MPKYKNLTELSAAFKSGELDKSYIVVMDKGGCDFSLMQFGPEQGENERHEKCKELFDPRFGNPMEELMGLAGIPSMWC